MAAGDVRRPHTPSKRSRAPGAAPAAAGAHVQREADAPPALSLAPLPPQGATQFMWRAAGTSLASRAFCKLCPALSQPPAPLPPPPQGATQFMWRAANSAMVLRLALLPDGPESSEALVFESASAGERVR